jgi:hypothetical protein
MKEQLISLFKSATNDLNVAKTGNNVHVKMDNTIYTDIVETLFPNNVGVFGKKSDWFENNNFSGKVINFKDKPSIYIGHSTRRYVTNYKRFLFIPINKKETKRLALGDMIKFENDLGLEFYSNFTDGRLLYSDFDYAHFKVNVSGYIITHGRVWAQLTKEEFDELYKAHEESIIKYDTNVLNERIENYK